MTRGFAGAMLVAVLCCCTTGQADVLNMGPGLTSLEMATVGDPGNAPDTRYETPGYGSVSYEYRIGKYEVTAAQYCEFLNAKAKSDPYGLYNTNMDTGSSRMGCNIERNGYPGDYSYSVACDWANRPVNCVSFWDACRFTNWLHNGQGDGDTETGAYTLNDYVGPYGATIERNAGARWVVPNEDEWYKAAYYEGGTSAGYWDYPTQSNTLPSNQLADPDPGNSATYANDGVTIGDPYYRTEVGAHENSDSAYGTFDQAGNVFEWNEDTFDDWPTYRVLRGGSFGEFDPLTHLHASDCSANTPTAEHGSIGFRVAAIVPEPSSILGLTCGLAALAGLRRRRL